MDMQDLDVEIGVVVKKAMSEKGNDWVSHHPRGAPSSACTEEPM